MGMQAWWFPGQGAQSVGMGRALYEHAPEARAIFERADEALGFSLSKLCFEGPIDELTRTENAQPALVTVGYACLEALRSRLPLRDASFAAGHSLGEYTALVSAGVLTLEDAVRTVRLRGQAMQAAVREGEGAMAAILAMDEDTVRALCEDAAEGEVVAPANFNAPGQIVIAGHTAAVARAAALAKTRGGRAIPLKVSAPFHCDLMKPAETPVAEALGKLTMGAMRIPVIANVNALAYGSAADTSKRLVDQIACPVRWADSVQFMHAEGVRLAFEFGPGGVLAGLAKRIAPSLDVIGVHDMASLDNALERLS